MRGRYLDVTFRHGRPLAAYLHLPRRPGRKIQTTRRAGQGLVVDLDVDGKPVGIEITAPQTLTLAALNEVLCDYHLPESTQEELTPLGVA